MSSDTGGRERRPDPEDDPFACSICGEPLGELKRVEGEDHCDACQREYGLRDRRELEAEDRYSWQRRLL